MLLRQYVSAFNCTQTYLCANSQSGLKEKKSGNFAGLQRIGDPEDGTALWTKLTDLNDIEDALRERAQRKEEEGKQKESASSATATIHPLQL